MTPEQTAADTAIGSIWTAVAILALLLLSAFFSGSETALTGVSRAKLRRLADQGSKGAKRAISLTDDGETLIGAILVGNNVVNILATSLATSLALALFGDSGVAIATLVMTVLVMIFAEVLPKTYAYAFSERASLFVSKPIGVLVRVLRPLVLGVQFIVRNVLKLFGVTLQQGAHVLSNEAHEEIRGAIDMHHYESGSVEKHDRDRLVGALDLGNRDIAEVMVHRRNIMMLNADSPPQELIESVLASPYTRIPLWRDEPENIVGVIHAKDLLRAVDKLIRKDAGGLEGVDNLDILKIAMEPWFVPDTTSLADQLREFLRQQSHFAIGDRRIRRAAGPHHAGGHSGGDRRRDRGRARHRGRSGVTRRGGRLVSRGRHRHDPRSQPRFRLGAARRGGHHRRRSRHPRGAGDSVGGPELCVPRFPLRHRDTSAQPDHAFADAASAAELRGVKRSSGRCRPRQGRIPSARPPALRNPVSGRRRGRPASLARTTRGDRREGRTVPRSAA